MTNPSQADAPWLPRGLAQPGSGYRYSIDALLLAAFASRFAGGLWCDLGTGCGVVAHELARRAPGGRGVAIERRPDLAACARLNLKDLPVTLIRGDLRSHSWRPKCLDLAVCNPPYFEPGRGRINRDRAIAEARHAFHGNLIDFAASIADALKVDGAFCFVFPFSSHENMLHRLGSEGWFPLLALPVRPFRDRSPNLICWAMSRQEKEMVELDCLTLYREHRLFHERAAAFFAYSDR